MRGATLFSGGGGMPVKAFGNGMGNMETLIHGKARSCKVYQPIINYHWILDWPARSSVTWCRVC